MSDANKALIRKILSKMMVVSVILFAGSFLLSRLGNIQDTFAALLSASPIIILPIFALTIIHIALYARILYACLKLTGVNINYRHVARLWLAQCFVNTMIPSGFFSGMAYLLIKVKKHSYNKVGVTMGVILSIFVAYITILFLFIATALLHINSPEINPVVKLSVQILAIIVGMITVISIIFAQQMPLLVRFLYHLRRGINSLLPDIEPFDFIDPVKRAGGVVSRVGGRWTEIIEPVIDNLLLHAVGLSMLWLSFHSLGYNVGLTAVITGYLVGVILTIVSITPAGIGFVEVIMPITLTSFSIPLPIATAVTVIWRLFTVWLVLIAGGISFRAIEKQGK